MSKKKYEYWSRNLNNIKNTKLICEQENIEYMIFGPAPDLMYTIRINARGKKEFKELLWKAGLAAR